MSEFEFKWTQQQQRAISQRGSDVLVTASAGTGKTAVLSGRCVDIVSDKDICPDAWSILVLTFTEAAAEQMRQRIAEQLTAAYQKNPDPHLRRQIVLLAGADISTIHSFCKRLITENFHELGLDPTFGIIDEDEQRLLKAEVLEQVVEETWQDSELAGGLQELLAGRDLRGGDGFLATVVEISDFLDGVVWPGGWYERALALSGAPNADKGILGREQRRIINERLGAVICQLQHAQAIYRQTAGGGDWAEKLQGSHIEPVQELLELQQRSWQEFADALRAFKKPRTSRPKELDEEPKELVHKTAKDAIGDVEKLGELAVLNPDYLDKIGRAGSRQSRVLVELVKQFEKLYSEAKRSLNRLDFADLERYALKLLAKEDSLSDKPEPSARALELRERYKYIFVDEYQDINPVQKAIVDLLSNPDSVFVVGDIKQSIYAFRGAEPRIFLMDLQAASVKSPAGDAAVRVDLNRNFRSPQALLDFVNLVFSRIMSGPVADIEYDESAKLRAAIVAQQGQEVSAQRAPVELHILDEKIEREETGTEDELTDTQRDIISARQRQAALIARRIRQMVGADTGSAEFEIYDKELGKGRPVEYRDIVILMRSLAKRANDYVEVLQLANVPVSCQAAAGYFEATEIADCLSLLKVLDNPQRDIELAAVLRGPLFELSDSELAKVRLFGKENPENKSFYDCVLAYSKSGPEKATAQNLNSALQQVEQWRRDAGKLSIADLLWQIYRQSKLLAFVSALPNGRGRRSNLLKLHDRAIQFEGFAASGGIASLGRFVSFVEKLQETGAEWSGTEPEDSADNAVRIMSVHKSKGLEFPVVFLAELDGAFNLSDMRKDVLVDVEPAIGVQVIDRKAGAKLSDAAHQIIAEKKFAINLAEEMRILYVAMTRAREKLVLTACEKMSICRKIARSGYFFTDGPIETWQMRKCSSALQWVLYALSNEQILHRHLETGIETGASERNSCGFAVYHAEKLKGLSDYVQSLRHEKSAARIPKLSTSKRPGRTSGLKEKVQASLDWRYSYDWAPQIPAKQSVTRLTHFDDEFAQMDYSQALERRPSVLLAEEQAPTEQRVIGIATHLVIAEIDLTKQVDHRAVESVIEKLISEEKLTAQTAGRVDVGSIVSFFSSELGRMACDAANVVEREWPFTFVLPVSEWAKIRGKEAATIRDEDTIIVQGIIDMLIETGEGLLIIDFKTDRVNTDEIAERAQSYAGQLQLYAMAAEAILKRKVLGRWVYFLAPACAVEIKD